MSDLNSEFTRVDEAISSIESAVAKMVQDNLLQKETGLWQGSDDDIFSPHTFYVQEAVKIGLPSLPYLLWENVLASMVDASEKRLGRAIHKGAPLYNTFLCLIRSGDLDKGFQYLMAASEENPPSGLNLKFNLFLGDNGLSEKVLIDPLVKQVLPVWQSDFQAVTGLNLDQQTFKELVKWLGQSPLNGTQAILALHRFRRLGRALENEFAQHLRLRALSDLVLVVESSLKHWQGGNDVLFERLKTVLTPNPTALASYLAAHNKFNANFPNPADRSLPLALDWSVSEAFSDLTSASSPSQKCGIGAYLCRQLRNSVMHVLEDRIGIYRNKADLLKCTGLVLALLQISKLGSENKISSLP